MEFRVDFFWAFVHLFEVEDEPVTFVEFSEVSRVGALLVKDLSDIGGLDLAGVAAHRDALVVDFLLKHSRREENIERGIDQFVTIILNRVELHLNFKKIMQ